jgi:hypothetical protein
MLAAALLLMGAAAKPGDVKPLLAWPGGGTGVSGKPLVLGTTPAGVQLSGKAGACEAAFAQDANRRFTLVLRGLRTKSEPGVGFRIFLNSGASPAATTRDAPGYVGDVNFYGLTKRSGTYSFDATAALAGLRKAGRAACPLFVVFATDSAVAAGSNPSVGTIQLIMH